MISLILIVSTILVAYSVYRFFALKKSGVYGFSRTAILVFWVLVLIVGGFVITLLIIGRGHSGSYADGSIFLMGFVFIMFSVAAYYSSVHFIVDNGTLAYRSLISTKIIDLTKPLTLTYYSASGHYVICQGNVKTKITGYIAGWQYLLEEIVKQSVSMEKKEK